MTIVATVLFAFSALAKEESLRDRPAAIELPFAKRRADMSLAADKKRDEAVAEIRKLLPKMNSRKKAELTFRLGELFFEKAKFSYSVEYGRFEKDLEVWVNKGRKGSEPSLGRYLRQAPKLRQESINFYSQVLKIDPDYPRQDEVFYALAYALLESGQTNAALNYFSEIAKRFEDSKYLADVHLALGDFYFDQTKLDQAESSYQKAKKRASQEGRNSVVAYALYKLAWCDYNQHRFDGALQKFKEVITMSDQGADAIRLRREALIDTVRTFAELKKVKEAYDFFKSQTDVVQANDFLEKLAEFYANSGDSPNQIAALRMLIDARPDHPNRAYIHAQIMEAQTRSWGTEELLAEANEIVKICQKKPGSDACTKAERSLRKFATETYRFAEQQKHLDDFRLSKALFETYLKGFEAADEAYRIRFFLGQAYFDLGEWDFAARQFSQVASTAGQFRDAAALNAVLALEKLLAGDSKPVVRDERLLAKASVNQKSIRQILSDNNRDLTEIENRYVAAIDQYVSILERQKRGEWMFKAAYLFQALGHFAPAEQRFVALIELDSSSKLAQDGALLILDGYDARRDWQQLLFWAKRFKKITPHAQRFEEAATFNLIADSYDKAKNQQLPTVEFATRYSDFVAQYKESQFAPKALFNAMLVFDEAGRFQDAIKAGEKWMGTQQNDAKKAEIVSATLARLNEHILEFGAAAKWYLYYATNFNNERTPDMLYNAALMSLLQKDYDGAIALFGRYLKGYPSRPDQVDAKRLVARIYQEMGRLNDAIGMLDGLQDSGAQKELALLLKKKGDPTKLQNTCRSLPKDGFCAYWLLEPKWLAYKSIRFDVSMAQLKKQIAVKRTAMKDLGTLYLDVLKTSDPYWGIAGLFRAAQVQLDFVRALREMRLPKKLPAEAKEAFQIQLEEAVLPVQEDAVDALEQALNKAFELGVYSEITLQIEKEILSADPTRQFSQVTLPLSFMRQGKPLSESQYQRSLASLRDELDQQQGPAIMLRLARIAVWFDHPFLLEWSLEKAKDAKAPEDEIAAIRAEVALRHENYPLAIPMLTLLAEKQTDAQYDLGALALRFGDEKRAEDAFLTVLKNDANHAWAEVGMGHIWAFRKDSKRAIAHFLRAFELDGSLATEQTKTLVEQLKKNLVSQSEVTK